MKEKLSWLKILLPQCIGFVTLIALSWFDELVGLRSLILGDHPYISDFKESTLEMLFVLAVWLLVFGATRRVLTRLHHLEGFMRVCAWCRRIRCDEHWMPLEEFLSRNFETRTTHGICEECLRKQEAVMNQIEAVPPATQTEAATR